MLASDAFGLVTTRSPGSEDDLSRYAELLGKKTRSLEEEAELEELGRHLEEALRFGENEFEQKVEAAVSETLKNIVTSARPEVLDLEARKQLRAIFRPQEPESR